MRTINISISIEEKVLKRLDQIVAEKKFQNRSKTIQSAVEEKIDRMKHNCLAEECAKLDVAFEQSLADEGFLEKTEK